ncbi:hypothetical protein EUX98_g8403 [Antrodiella citrinella]|uniref:Cytochrome P450 n=1 Tax=Antrodiella citrinella TaxID=2447956 RepID=A0A4S4M832_9APHY|nr:hypothetical protein EUX98_g8403 [Antrodiella citrinella]
MSSLEGNLSQFFDRRGWTFVRELGEKFGGVVPMNGFFGQKILYVFDPKALHHVCVKDTDIYDETEGFLIAGAIMFGKSILSTRVILMHMHATLQLKTALVSQVEKDSKKDVDVARWMSRTALELIGQAGLGHSFDSLAEDKPNAYVDAMKALPAAVFALEILRPAVPYLYTYLPKPFLRWLVEVLPSKRLTHAKDLIDTLWNVNVDILAQKRAAIATGGEEEVKEGNDLISCLLRENMKASDEERMEDEELLGMMSGLTFAATDTTSTALALTLCTLAAHPEAQAKLRQELREARADGQELSYDTVTSLPYLDAVCRETLRLSTPVPYMTREASRDAVLPLHTPIRGKDGQMVDEVVVPARTMLVLGITATNRTPVLWGDDAHEWKPERWLEALPDSVLEARIPGIYSHLMTFLAGNSGFKFSQLEMKVILAMLVETFTFDFSEKEIYWNWAGIIYPTVGSVDTKTQMPLRVGLAKDL